MLLVVNRPETKTKYFSIENDEDMHSAFYDILEDAWVNHMEAFNDERRVDSYFQSKVDNEALEFAALDEVTASTFGPILYRKYKDAVASYNRMLGQKETFHTMLSTLETLLTMDKSEALKNRSLIKNITVLPTISTVDVLVGYLRPLFPHFVYELGDFDETCYELYEVSTVETVE